MPLAARHTKKCFPILSHSLSFFIEQNWGRKGVGENSDIVGSCQYIFYNSNIKSNFKSATLFWNRLINTNFVINKCKLEVKKLNLISTLLDLSFSWICFGVFQIFLWLLVKARWFFSKLLVFWLNLSSLFNFLIVYKKVKKYLNIYTFLCIFLVT